MFADIIEKRKSFADMKLAEVAHASQATFSFDSSEPATENSAETVADNEKKKAEDAVEAGKESNGDVVFVVGDSSGNTAATDNAAPTNATTSAAAVTTATVTVTATTTTTATASVALNDSGGSSSLVSSEGGTSRSAVMVAAAVTASSSNSNKEKKDPVVEVCPDLQVKIADLGNACWVVRVEIIFRLLAEVLGVVRVPVELSCTIRACVRHKRRAPRAVQALDSS